MSNETTRLAPGLEVSKVITGLWQIADMERDGRELDLDRLSKYMQPYVDAGLTTFDVADHYGASEEIVGIFNKNHAGDTGVQALTKWVPDPEQQSAQAPRAAVERALTRLQTDRLDLLQYHTWHYADPRYLDDLFQLQALKDDGLIGQLALVNFDSAHVNLAIESGIDIVSNQVSFSLLDQRAGNKMAEVCERHGIKILAFGTLAGGFLTEKWLDKPEPGDGDELTWSHMKYKRYIDVAGGWDKFQNLLRAMKQIADRHGVSMANVATRYILDQPAVGAVIIGARLGESEHIENNRALLQFAPENRDWDAIRNALAELDPIPGDCGDEYRKPPFLTASGDLSHHLETLPPPYPTKACTNDRTLALSGTVWEDIAGYSRATRKGDRILVSGTTATHGERVIGGKDPAAQAHFAIDKLEGAIQSLGGRLEDVVRTRVFIRNLNDWEAVSMAHGQRFGEIQPANTMVQAGLIGDEYLVEMEAEAIC